MSKRSKAAAKVKRQASKRAKKKAMQAQYEAWRDAGVTKGSRRASKRQKAGVKTIKGRSGRRSIPIPWPYHMWSQKDGSWKPGMPHWAWQLRPGQ